MIPFVQDADFTLIVGDVREALAELPDESVDCVVTSPPYWGLRNYGVDGQLGLEPTPDLYVEAMVGVFREVRRVLALHGTAWINLGDSYAAQTNGGAAQSDATTMTGGRKAFDLPARTRGGLKPKDLVGIPWRVAFALQADGWYLRSDIVWSKPNPMPESVTDRPTKAHEYVFLLTKAPRYWFDAEAVREPHNDKAGGPERFGRIGANGGYVESERTRLEGVRSTAIAKGNQREYNPAGRNIRSVWEIATQPYAEAHFATYPEELVRRCLLAGCPEWVCGTCGVPRTRIVGEVDVSPDPSQRSTAHYNTADRYGAGNGGNGGFDALAAKMRAGVGRGSVGWSDCGHANYRPGVVLDPFMGSGTTALVARRHGRRSIGIELNPDYAALCAKRLQQLSLLAEGDAA